MKEKTTKTSTTTKSLQQHYSITAPGTIELEAGVDKTQYQAGEPFTFHARVVNHSSVTETDLQAAGTMLEVLYNCYNHVITA